MNLQMYSEVKSWKKPIHMSRTAIARAYLKLIPNIEIIGIAGSVGKTLTQNAIYSVLSQKYSTVTGEENLDPTFRIPQTILKAKLWDKYLILEYGVEHPGEMDHYLNITQPKYAVMTTISAEHTKYFGDMEGVIAEESKFIKNLNKNTYAILNADDPYSHGLAKQTKAIVVWYGQKAKRGVKISHYSQNLHGSKFRIHYGGQMASVHWKVVGRHQLASAYAAATLGILCGLTVKQISKGLYGTKVPTHRLELRITDHVNIIDDTYNSSPAAAIESVKTLVELGRGRKKTAILGEMKDLGTLSAHSHAELGQKIAKTSINNLITIGQIAKTVGDSAKKFNFRGKIYSAKSPKEALKLARPLAGKKTLILIKGSRHAHLERIALGLLHKSTHINCYHCGKLN